MPIPNTQNTYLNHAPSSSHSPARRFSNFRPPRNYSDPSPSKPPSPPPTPNHITNPPCLPLVAMKQAPSDVFIHSDCAVPISKLPALIAGTQNLITAATPMGSKWFCANVGHVGDGNVHCAIICWAEDKELAEAVIKQICRLALSLEGTVMGEHGVGMKLRDMLEEEVGSVGVGVGVMRSIKEALDPRGIVNPGKVFVLEEGDAKAKL